MWPEVAPAPARPDWLFLAEANALWRSIRQQIPCLEGRWSWLALDEAYRFDLACLACVPAAEGANYMSYDRVAAAWKREDYAIGYLERSLGCPHAGAIDRLDYDLLAEVWDLEKLAGD